MLTLYLPDVISFRARTYHLSLDVTLHLLDVSALRSTRPVSTSNRYKVTSKDR